MVQSYKEMWDQSLAALAQRQGAVEITRLVPRDADNVDTTFRARLLHFDPGRGRLRVEQIQEVSLHPDSKVKVVVRVHSDAEDGPDRCQSLCTVGSPVKLTMSDGGTVLADDLAAGDVQQVQRRSFFRVNAGECSLPPVKLTPTEKGLWPIEVKLVNISAGGLGVSLRATPQQVKTLPQCRTYHGEISLPDLKKPICATVRLAHFKVLPQDMLYLGLRFEFASKTECHELQETIVKFITRQQQKQLQRQRGLA